MRKVITMDRARLTLATAEPRVEMPLLSVVLPVYNEAGVLSSLTETLTECLSQLHCDYEIVMVNDGSTDDSSACLDRLALGNPQIRVVHLSRNFGHQAAVQAGLEHAHGDAVVLMDADMQDAPQAIAEFFDAWRQGYDVVYALRTARKEHPLKRSLFAGFYRFLAAISPTPLPLDAGNFGLVDARVARLVAALGERDRYFPGLRSWVGFRQIGVPVERNARYDEHPRVSLWGLFRLAKTAVFSFSSFPLAVFSVIGCLALALFVGLSGYSLFCKLLTNLAIPGWTSHVLIGSFFGALNALGVSMLGEYVIRIYDQVRGRPLFLVDRTVNVPDVCGTAVVNAARRRQANRAAQADTLPPITGDDALYDEVFDQAQQLQDETAALARPKRRRAGKKVSTAGRSAARGTRRKAR